MSFLSLLLPALREQWFNHQTAHRAWQVGEAHYDLGNDFYRAMLGPSMAYTCEYWQTAKRWTKPKRQSST